MSGQLCDICYRWFSEPYHAHNLRHMKDDPHTFCRVANVQCDQGECPATRTYAQRDAEARAAWR